MQIIKFILFMITVCCFFLTTLPLFPFLFIAPWFSRSLLIDLVSFYSWVLLKILGIQVNFKNLRWIDQKENYLIVSNHLSYLDVLILASRFPSCFVTSREVKATPFLGQIAMFAGCLFVDRKDKIHLKDEIHELRSALHAGLNVTVFPEATSTNGDEVLRFRRPLFESSLATGKAILPITINYQSISKREVKLENRDLVCWYGEMDFLPHLWKLMGQSEVCVDIIVAEPFRPEMMAPIELAFKSHRVVAQSYKSLNSLV